MNTLKLDTKDLMEVFDAVSGRDYKSLRRLWIQSDEDRFRDLRNKRIPNRGVAEILGRSLSSVDGKAKALGLTRPTRLWTPEEDQTLRRLSRRKFDKWAIAQKLDRTEMAIEARASLLKVHLGSREFWSPEKDSRLITLYNIKEPLWKISKIIGKSYSACNHRLDTLGIIRPRRRK